MSLNRTNYSIFDRVIFRVPAFSLQASLQDKWVELQNAIALASPEFFKLISDTSSKDIDKLPANVVHTIWKYFNRARFRATPYGTFASIGLIDFEPSITDKRIKLDDKVLEHHFVSWEETLSVAVNIQTIKRENAYLVSNSSFYVLGEIIRYLSHMEDKFELSEIDNDDRILFILKVCAERKRYSEVHKELTEIFDNSSDIDNCLSQLIDVQLIRCSLHSNIIGEDYFVRTRQNFPDVRKYIISERTSVNKSITSQDLRHLPGLVELLSKVNPYEQQKEMDAFIAGFRLKFEMREVPLLIALDPEAGISYGTFSSPADSQGLAHQFVRSIPAENVQTAQLEKFLLQLGNQGKQPRTLDLNDFPKTEHDSPFPNTVAVLLSDADGQLALEALSGVTANSLIGRFTICSSKIEGMAKDIVKFEKSANPEVVFFDIAYQGEPEVDNVNRRSSIYDYQLSIIDYDTSSHPLCFHDLYLYLSGNELFLCSRKLGKRLVPRLSSAYNYTRSDVPVFRFLCDLQRHGIQYLAAPNLQSLLRGRDAYPRVMYQNIIVSKASWRVKKSLLDKAANDDVVAIKSHLEQRSVSRYFRCGNGDQRLNFDIESKEDLKHFLVLLGKHQELIIEEAWRGVESRVTDRRQAPFHSELLVTLHHGQSIYRGMMKSDQRPMTKDDRLLLPGKWLYFEIFVHPQRADELLDRYIAPFVFHHREKINKWFFVRYSQNGEHLRLRIELKTKRSIPFILERLGKALKPGIEDGIIQDFTLRTYRRELERYGWVGISAIETHFQMDSECVVDLLKHSPTTEELYHLVIESIVCIGSKLFEPDYFFHLLERLNGSLSREHNLNVQDFKNLNASYIRYRKAEFRDLDTLASLCNFRTSLYNILESCRSDKRSQLFADLLHMHVNRIFNTVQRTHEMIIYDYAIKEMKRKRALAAS